jgi:hypothetical protein
MTEESWRAPPSLAWLQALRQPEQALDWSQAEWQRVVRLARRLRLLARLAEGLDHAGLLAQVPAPARRHLHAEQRLSRWRTGAMLWALERVGAALQGATYPRVLLKGAAYAGQELPLAHGRLPSDVDILVPAAHLDDAQQRLQDAGWSALELDAHDQRYYREWSHEIAPMRHPAHAIELDVHHDILPPIARTHVEIELLLARIAPSRWPAWQVLDPLDQVLHSAAHLFHDSELRDRLRDLVDLDGLMRLFGKDADFWPRLVQRAFELGLCESLAPACHFAALWLGTPVPAAVRAEIIRLGPTRWQRAWMLPLLTHVLTPTEPDARPAWAQSLSAGALLMRYHRHRMPLRLLLPHVWHKVRLRPEVAALVDPGPR